MGGFFMNQGLSSKVAAQRLATDGPNEVKMNKTNLWTLIGRRLWEPTAWIIEGALVIELIAGNMLQAGFIVALLFFAAINGALQNQRAVRALAPLTKQVVPDVSVLRDGQWKMIPARLLVRDDVINLRSGNLVPADVQIIDGMITTNESLITGESEAIQRSVGMTLMAGTQVERGVATAIVLRTGAASQVGKITQLVTTSHAPGRLQHLLQRIINLLAAVDAVLVVVLAGAALMRHEPLLNLLPLIGVLFIATIPIAMPSSFSVANSLEARKLSDERIIVRELNGIQTAATVDTVLFDKTGTLTTNKPVIDQMVNLSDYPDKIIIAFAQALTDWRQPSRVDQALQNLSNPVKDEVTIKDYQEFSTLTGYSAATIMWNHHQYNVQLGAPRIVHNGSYLVTMKFKRLVVGQVIVLTINNRPAALFALDDQLRSDAQETINRLIANKIHPVMVTGDSIQAARIVAKKLGIPGRVITGNELAGIKLSDVGCVAEVLPEGKLALVQQFQAAGHVVAMTGDGVNDAPALKRADVGIAMYNASAVAKRTAKVTMLDAGLLPLLRLFASGHRVYQRMMTWTITKLARTAELTVILTLGYVIAGILPVSLNAIIMLAILNDVVTMVLGTDRVQVTFQPEKWNFKRLTLIAGLFTVFWTALGLGLFSWLYYGVYVQPTTIETVMYLYLMFTAMDTIWMTRTTGLFWKEIPSAAVIYTTLGNCLLSFVFAVGGVVLAPVPWQVGVIIFGGCLLLSFVVDGLKVMFYRREIKN